MVLNLYSKWRYRRIGHLKLNSVDCLLYLLNIAKLIEFKQISYKKRVKYKVRLRTNNLEELLLFTDNLMSIIKKETEEIDGLSMKSRSISLKKLDTWFVDEDNVPYNDIEGTHILLRKTSKLYNEIRSLESKNQPLYFYYSQVLKFILNDYIDSLNTIIAMQLAVDKIKIDLE